MKENKIMTRGFFLLFIIISTCFISSCSGLKDKSNTEKEITQAPFTGIDTIATNDWWNRKTNRIIDVKVERENVIAFGIYIVHNNILKLSAQLFPLYQNETREVRLEIKRGEKWKE